MDINRKAENRKQFFNSLAKKWDNIVSHDTVKINKVLDLLDIRQGDKLLDIGSGTGILIPFLSSRVGERGEIVAVDIAAEMIKIARKKFPFPNVKFIPEDIVHTNFSGKVFDHAIFYSVFPHLDDKKFCIERIKTYLKDGGKITIFHSQSRAWINDMHRKKSEAVKYDYLPDMATIKGYFVDCAMQVVLEIDSDEMFVVIARK